MLTYSACQAMLYAKQLSYCLVTLQVLICPALDLADLNTPSYTEFEDDACESKADLMWFWDQYLQASAQIFLGLVQQPCQGSVCQDSAPCMKATPASVCLRYSRLPMKPSCIWVASRKVPWA